MNLWPLTWCTFLRMAPRPLLKPWLRSLNSLGLRWSRFSEKEKRQSDGATSLSRAKTRTRQVFYFYWDTALVTMILISCNSTNKRRSCISQTSKKLISHLLAELDNLYDYLFQIYMKWKMKKIRYYDALFKIISSSSRHPFQTWYFIKLCSYLGTYLLKEMKRDWIIAERRLENCTHWIKTNNSCEWRITCDWFGFYCT